MDVNDPFNLRRFADAQASVYDMVVNELAAGCKRTHWMWFIFPQLRGLGRSWAAQFYGLVSLEEARAYFAHRELGPRLVACTRSVLAVDRRSLNAIFGSPDDMKFQSSMTIFALAAEENENVFRRALARFCGGSVDGRTLALLNLETEGR
jgi:uncharacterized protein (DUF1810 family)